MRTVARQWSDKRSEATCALIVAQRVYVTMCEIRTIAVTDGLCEDTSWGVYVDVV